MPIIRNKEELKVKQYQQKANVWKTLCQLQSIELNILNITANAKVKISKFKIYTPNAHTHAHAKWKSVFLKTTNLGT